jgi:hypothetical protein
MTEMEWILVLGALSLASWMAAGFTTVLGTREAIRHASVTKPADLLSFAFALTGVISALMMAVALVRVWNG